MNLNDKGQVVGWSRNSAGNVYPFLWNPTTTNGTTGQMINLGTIGTPGPWTSDTMATDINESGRVVGKVLFFNAVENSWYTRGFVITPSDVDGNSTPDWYHDANSDGKNDLMRDLGVLTSQSNMSEANAINDSGGIVGEAGSTLSRIEGHAVRWTPSAGTWTIADMGGLHGRLYHSSANDIDSSSRIVGYSQEMVRTLWGSGGVAGYEPVGERRAFFQVDTMKALDTLVSGMAGFSHLNNAKAISDNRYIVGEGKVGSFRHAFIAVPIVLAQQATSAGLGAAESLTGSQIDSLVAEAVLRWKAAGVDTSSLKNLNIRIADLPGTTLGQAQGNTIILDSNAAGWGWFVDKTPRSDAEFRLRGNQGEQARMDLLSVLMHEMGHVLGYKHHNAGVMQDTLTPGERSLPVGMSSFRTHGNSADLVFAMIQERNLRNR